MALPPGPSAGTSIQAVNWILRPGPWMESSLRRYGDMFTLRLPVIGAVVYVADPAAIKRIFTADPDLLRAGEANATLEPVLGPRSVLLLDGAEHLRQRRLMLPPFHGERLGRYRELIARITDEELDRWPLGEPFRLQDRMQAITLEVIVRVVFGVEDATRRGAMRRVLKDMILVSTSRTAMLPFLARDIGPWRPMQRFQSALAAMDAALYDEIARRRADPALEERDDILSLFLLARDEDGNPMTDPELRDELVTLLMAGHETTATSLAWAFERLFRHPAALERLEQEARDGGGGEYADAVCKETLRLRPPIPVVARRLQAPWELKGYELPAGTLVAPCIWLVHRLPHIYPQPEEFRPERFLDMKPDTYAWLPFGGGIRRCVGASFALFEMKVVLETLLARATLRAPSARSEPVRRRAIVLAPGRGGRAVLEERRPSPAPTQALAA